MRLFTKENMMKLTTEERGEIMRLQMSRSYSRSNYLPEDCSECTGCGDTILGSGFCNYCYKRFEELTAKMRR